MLSIKSEKQAPVSEEIKTAALDDRDITLQKFFALFQNCQSLQIIQRMLKMNSKLVLLAGVLTCIAPIANATIISGYGAYASTSTASNCPSFCTSANGGDFAYDSAGAEFSETASATESSYASANAYSSLAGATYLPDLKVATSAARGRAGSASAFGVQGFTYAGAATTITLDFNLHGSVGDNAAGYASNALGASVAVFIGSHLDWHHDFSTLVYEVADELVYQGILERAGLESVFIADGNDVNVTGSIEFDINDNQDFFVIASTTARSKNGYADAWNTLTLNFTDDTGLTAALGGPPAIAAVPAPAAAWLVTFGLLAVFGFSRRQTQA